MTRWLNKRWRVHAMLAGTLCVGMACGALAAQPAPDSSSASTGMTLVTSAMSLEQAVAKVQGETHGKVLRADTRQYGDAPEYRIKVLTPDGHVRVISVRARPARASED